MIEMLTMEMQGKTFKIRLTYGQLTLATKLDRLMLLS